jgi:hypothetical protein
MQIMAGSSSAFEATCIKSDLSLEKFSATNSTRAANQTQTVGAQEQEVGSSSTKCVCLEKLHQ